MNKLTKTFFLGIVFIPLTIILLVRLDRYVHPYSFVTPQTTVISINSLVCNMCVSNVEDALKKTEGVISTEVSLESREAYVRFNDDITNVAAIEKSITEAGYDANDKQKNPEAFAKLSECCKNPETGQDHGSKCEGKSEMQEHQNCSHRGGCCNN